jgi:L-iditol 2-dehydrogenase
LEAQMKALIHTQPYELKYTDFPDPVPKEDEVLIRIKACGICGSDVHGYTGKTGRRIPPVIMGHEAAGIIEDVGAKVENFSKGDRVCFDSTVYCNKCEPCRRGFYNRCEMRQVLGVSTPEFKRHGAFAEFVAVPWWIVTKIPHDLPFTQAALLEPVSIGVHAVNRAPLSDTKTVVVIGAGTIGLCITQAAKLKGADKIIVSEVNDFRLGIAKEVGADVVVNASKIDLREMVFEATNNQGADVAYEAVGLAKTFQQAMDVTKTGGHLTVVGLSEKMVTINVQGLVSRELTVRGSYASAGEYRDCVELVASGKINVEPLISEVLPLSEGQRAFDRLHKAEENLLKIILEP